jgi:hypothetical protein
LATSTDSNEQSITLQECSSDFCEEEIFPQVKIKKMKVL